MERGFALLEHDRALGVRFVAGCDEAGRGSLAGPLVAAAVCLDLQLDLAAFAPLARLDDSKTLAAPIRAELYDAVLALATAVSVQVVAPQAIDRGGVHRANLAALAEALVAVTPPAEVLLSDHYHLPHAPVHRPLTRGDSTSAAIAAAAIVAKVTRDRLMREYAVLYPVYGFEQNVGYMTRAHQAAVVAHGPSPLHRLSFAAACYAEHRARAVFEG